MFTCLLNDFFVNPKGEVQTRGVKRPTKINKNEADSFGTRVKTTLETSGEDVKTTLETSGEDVKTTLVSSGEDVFSSLI